MNDNANIKQFQFIRFIYENCNDDHVISRSSIVLRRDKIEAPYYMITKVKLSFCVDKPDNGLIHAMDIMNHSRRHNLTEETYDEIKLLIESCNESDQVKIIRKDKELKIELMTKDYEDFHNLINEYQELFDKIDNLMD